MYRVCLHVLKRMQTATHLAQTPTNFNTFKKTCFIHSFFARFFISITLVDWTMNTNIVYLSYKICIFIGAPRSETHKNGGQSLNLLQLAAMYHGCVCVCVCLVYQCLLNEVIECYTDKSVQTYYYLKIYLVEYWNSNVYKLSIQCFWFSRLNKCIHDFHFIDMKWHKIEINLTIAHSN